MARLKKAKPPEEPTQEFIWVPRGQVMDGYNQNILIVAPIPYAGPRPDTVWSLVNHRDPHAKPGLPFVWFTAVHGVNAFLEDWGHDINIRKGNLIYRSRFSDGGHWILLEFEGKKPKTKKSKKLE